MGIVAGAMFEGNYYLQQLYVFFTYRSLQHLTGKYHETYCHHDSSIGIAYPNGESYLFGFVFAAVICGMMRIERLRKNE